MEKRVHKSLFADLSSWFSSRRQSTSRTTDVPTLEFDALVKQYQGNTAELRAHIDSMTGIILDLTDKASADSELIRTLQNHVSVLERQNADLRRGRKAPKTESGVG